MTDIHCAVGGSSSYEDVECVGFLNFCNQVCVPKVVLEYFVAPRFGAWLVMPVLCRSSPEVEERSFIPSGPNFACSQEEIEMRTEAGTLFVS